MSNPVVLITGDLTGIGRAAAIPSPRGERRSLLPVGVTRLAGRSPRSCGPSNRRPSSSAPTSARRMTSALWSTRLSLDLAVSMLR
jgi:hypothetical protein